MDTEIDVYKNNITITLKDKVARITDTREQQSIIGHRLGRRFQKQDAADPLIQRNCLLIAAQSTDDGGGEEKAEAGAKLAQH